MIALVGVLNVIHGAAAIADSRFFVDDATYILSGLSTWGWVMLILGAAQRVAAYSISKGGEVGHGSASPWRCSTRSPR